MKIMKTEFNVKLKYLLKIVHLTKSVRFSVSFYDSKCPQIKKIRWPWSIFLSKNYIFKISMDTFFNVNYELSVQHNFGEFHINSFN